MHVAAVVVEHVGYDGQLRTLQMQADPGRTLTIALADEFDEPHSGPFHFLDEHHKEIFEKGFAECKAWKLSESNFAVVDGDYCFRNSWQGIPTGRNCLSCYSLSLPEFAVPTEIRFKDPHSDREYSKSVIRDNRRNRFVAYLECRSSYGSFDFLLEVRFRRDPDKFRSTTYTDKHMARHGAQIRAYESLVPVHLQAIVQQFISPNAGPLQLSPAGVPSQPGLFPSVTLISTDRVEIVGERTAPQSSTEPNGSKPKHRDKLPPKKADLSSLYLDAARLTDAQREVASFAWEYGLSISEIARRLGKNRSSIQERLVAATKKIEEALSSEKQAMRRAKHPDHMGERPVRRQDD
jgi:predicted DNA-binding protein YlxM (UPF0122 family)